MPSFTGLLPNLTKGTFFHLGEIASLLRVYGQIHSSRPERTFFNGGRLPPTLSTATNSSTGSPTKYGRAGVRAMTAGAENISAETAAAAESSWLEDVQEPS